MELLSFGNENSERRMKMMGWMLLPFLCFIELAAVYMTVKEQGTPLDLEDFEEFYNS
jgi:hypothetical protein